MFYRMQNKGAINTGLFGGQDMFLQGKRTRRICVMQIAFSFYGKWRGLPEQITLLVFGQKISDWLVKVTLLGEAETAIRSCIKARRGIMGFQPK